MNNDQRQPDILTEADKAKADAGARGDSTLPVPSENTLSHSEGVIDSGIVTEARTLPLWQRRYLVTLQSTASLHETRLLCKISDTTVEKVYRSSDVFARAYDEVIAGRALFGVEAGRELAEADAGSMIVDAVVESRDRDNAPRDRLGNRRLVLEVAGAMPQRGIVVAPVINVGVSVINTQEALQADTVDGVVVERSGQQSDDRGSDGP